MPQTPPNWDSLKSIVADALELAPDQREPFLTRACNGDDALLTEVRSLVQAYESADGVIDRRTDAWLGLGGPDLLSLGGQRIGRYTLERLLAEGAMAAVYLAKQINPHRTVALKLVRCSLPLVDAASRFKRESEALGRLAHPNIARIYEAGVHGHGAGNAMPFIAMEYIDGPPLTAWARQHKLSRANRIRLMIKVASAIHAAHQQAIIHRDLKPANVLVDPSGEPKVLDFGIARIVGADERHQTWQTTAGVLLGTPGYMSPEQAAGRADLVDVRSDVWALGVMLHELLTDRLPVEVANTSIAEVLRRIETVEPQPIGKIDPSLRGDLETVVMTALSREKQRRYSSAQAMADDLRRVLEYEPILARAPTRWYRARKFIRRNRLAFVSASGLVLLLAAASVFSTLQFVRARRERDKAQAINQFLQEIISSADPTVAGKDITVLQALNAAESRVASGFPNNPLIEAAVRSTLGWTYFNLGEYDRANRQITRAVELRQANAQANAPETFDDQCRLVTILRWQYRPQEALDVARPAYEAARQTLGEEHSSTVAFLDPIAGCAADMGDLETAEREYITAVSVNKRVMGADNEQTLTALNNLAVVYGDRGKYAQAEATLRELIAARQRNARRITPAIISNRLNLAVVISELGRLDDAEKEMRELATESERTLGADHDTTITIRTNHAETLQRLGRSDDALAIQQEAMQRRIRVNGGMAHDASIKDMSNYSSLLAQAQRFEEARQYAQQARDAAVALHGQDHMAIAATTGNLALALDGLKQHDQAQALFRQVIAFYETQFGSDHNRTLVMRSNLAASLISVGRGAEALAILEPVLGQVQRRNMGFMEAAVHRHIGRALTLEKRFAEAETHLLKAHQLAEARKETRKLEQTSEALADLYEAWQKPGEARRWRGGDTLE
jgi:serine/threonine protein kinase